MKTQEMEKKAHPNEIILVNANGSLTSEGLKLAFQKLSPAQREVLNSQALRQEVFGS